MAKIDPEFLKILKSSPQKSVSVIIRTRSNAQAKAAQLADAGLKVTQTFNLVPGFAVTGPGGDILALLDKPWILSVEADKPVQISEFANSE